MGKQARVRALRSTIKTLAKSKKTSPRELSHQLFTGKVQGNTRRKDESLQAAWYFLRKDAQ